MEFFQNNKFLKIFIAVLIIFFILFSFSTVYLYLQNQQLKNQITVTNFDECSLVKGATIQYSYPATCVMPSGEKFVQELTDEEMNSLVSPEDNSQIGNDENTSVSKDGCIVGGCSGEICQDKDEEQMASICLYKEEYDCYKKAVCERQSDGKCGWTQTDELKTCLRLQVAFPYISEADLSRGWYWGDENQKKPGTPDDWVYTEAGRSSSWHKVGADYSFPPND